MSKDNSSVFEKLTLRAKYSWNTFSRKLLYGKQPRQIIFIHVPKCAGTSAWKQIKNIVGPRWLGRTVMLLRDPKPTDPGYEELIAKCRRARFVSGHISWATAQAIREDRDAFIFTVLRDPAERLRSLYRYIKHLPKDHRAPENLALDYAIADMSPDEFFSHSSPWLRGAIDNFMTRQLGGHIDRIPSNDVEWERLLEQAKVNLAQLDFICFQETFEEDFPTLLYRAGLPALHRVRRMNVTPNRSHRSNAASRALFGSDETYTRLIQPLILWDEKLYGFARWLHAR